nr:hypothetical protein [Chloroflexia bacterium]
TLVTEDRLRLQLASMFGLAERERDPAPAAPAAGASLPSSAAFSGWRKPRQAQDATSGEPPAEADPIATSRRRRTRRYAPGTTPDRATVAVPAETVEQDEATFAYLDETGSRRARLLGSAVAVLAAITLVAAALGWYYMPELTVRATLREAPVGTALLYSVTAPDASAPPDAAFSVPAERLSDTVSFAVTIPATGVQKTPEGTASGTVTLRNASTAAIALPAGTALANRAGTGFVTAADVEVPAGSADGSTIGEIAVGVTAAAPGSAGNLGQGELTGKVADQPVYFTNRDAAIAGGTDREVKVVAEADIAELENRIENDLRRVAAEGWGVQLGEARAVVGPSVEPAEPSWEIGQSAGDISDTVTMTGTVEANGLVYDLAAVEAQARASFIPQLQGQIPAGYALDESTIALGEPELLSESPATVEYQVTATANARAVFDEGAEANLTEAIAGSSWSNAEAAVANVPAFATWEVERDPEWWPSRAPQASDRVTVEVAAAPTAAPAAPGSTPVATPPTAGAIPGTSRSSG